MTTYLEPVERWRIVRHEELPEAHKAEYRLNGIDPDTLWTLIWSFPNEDDARTQLADCIAHAAKWQTFKLVDGGAREIVERQAWF
jgi:hypothetical protein